MFTVATVHIVSDPLATYSSVDLGLDVGLERPLLVDLVLVVQGEVGWKVGHLVYGVAVHPGAGGDVSVGQAEPQLVPEQPVGPVYRGVGLQVQPAEIN